MNPLRSVGAQLSLALAVLVAGSLGVVYLFVVPSLERNLVNAKLSQLERVAPDIRRQLARDKLGINDPDFVGNASDDANARVVVFGTLVSNPATLTALADSRQGGSSADVENDPVALRAAATVQQQHGTLSRGDERFAEVAIPLPGQQILLLSASLHDSLGNVHLVQRRLLVDGVAALLASLALGFGGASIFARRIRRLERGADRIASGHFDELVGAARALGDDERALRIGRALVENALRHTPSGTQVVVRAGGGARPVLEVADDGPGIPASELGQVFDRFYRGNGSLASGSGLGLAIACELAERMDGRLEVESRPGHTVFRLVLPPAEAFSRENAQAPLAVPP